jgi:hypothetical protein
VAPIEEGCPYSADWELRRASVRKKPTKTREELSAIIFSQLKHFAEGPHAVTGVVIAPVVRPDSSHPNWHAAFTVQVKRNVPHIAWQIGSDVADEFDLA